MNFICGLLLALSLSVTSAEDDGHYVNSWAAEILGGVDVAREVAEQHGYRLVRSLENFPDHYLLERSDTPHRSRRSADHHTKRLAEDDRVVFVEQQQHRNRVKRGVIDRDPSFGVEARERQLNDPEYPQEWYLNQADTRSNRRDGTLYDLNVREVWEMGITGEGVTVSIVDDGVETDHPDLVENYDPKASHDFNDNDDNPNPRYDPTNENKHGTRCAGEIAMMANNKICGVGIAHNAKIGGLRILDGTVTDSIEGQALAFNRDHIDIYSSSWGPNDDGKTCEGPGRVTKKALEDGVKKGRRGLGSIFVWASGNGGRYNDNCNNDGYTSDIRTISISSASQEGKSPYYTERCSSSLSTTYSSGSSSEGKVVTSDLHSGCTDGHTGTSAAAPMAAGIYALVLQANGNLTWRDVQHLTVHTSRMSPLASEKGWYRNGANYCVNLAFGFGLMDALAMVQLAKTWTRVGEQKICRVELVGTGGFPKTFTSGQSVTVEFKTDGCKGQENEINYLEHVQVVADIDHEKRGNIYAELKSPSGTITPVMQERENDRSKKGFVKWPFTSTHNWGENPDGTWFFTVADRKADDNFKGSLKSATLILYGTTEQPEHQKHIISQCPELEQSADTLTNIIEIDRDSNTYGGFQGLKKLFSSHASSSQNGKTDKAQKKPPLPNSNIQSALEAILQLG